MGLFSETNFFICLAVTVIGAIILGLKGKNIKYYGFAVSGFFVFMAMLEKPAALAYLAGFCIYDFALIRIYLEVHRRKRKHELTYWLFITLSIAPLAVSKILGTTGNPHHILAFLGISYMTFKGTQIIIEIYDELITRVKAFDFFYLMLFFPAITSGPIDRSRRFSEDLERMIPKSEYADMAGTGLFRICLGLFYKVVIAALFYQAMTVCMQQNTLYGEIGYMYTYGFYLFFDFAGYSHMAIGAGYIFGIKVPENFDRPFISKDIKEFWNRWHMTLSMWFIDFIFSRMMMRILKKKVFKNRLTGSSIAFVVNMSIMGAWHGLTSYYLMYGLYHGLLLAFTDVYQRKSKIYKKHRKEKGFKLLEWFVTFNLVMFGFYLFSGRLTHILMIPF